MSASRFLRWFTRRRGTDPLGHHQVVLLEPDLELLVQQVGQELAGAVRPDSASSGPVGQSEPKLPPRVVDGDGDEVEVVVGAVVDEVVVVGATVVVGAGPEDTTTSTRLPSGA